MATLNASKWGHIDGPQDTSFSNARGATAGTAVEVNPTNTHSDAVRYSRYGRGTLYYQFNRAFFYFDTSGISSTPSSATINIKGGGAFSNAAPLNVVASTAFSGDGSTNLVTGDFDQLNQTKARSTSTVSTWSNNSVNSISLNSTSLGLIGAQNQFIVALIENDHDSANQAEQTAELTYVGIDYSTTPYLDYTVGSSGPANLTSLNSITKSNITSANTITLANITSINTIA